MFLEKWNGVSLLWDTDQPAAVMTSDASGTLSDGAVVHFGILNGSK